ncbi:hypothetical protein AB3Y40_14025 [Yoonia sp. R2331]|uniref:hypothetical protein n=1 Tax=Yoonia sp. R2331 TaxID=3237238 RepID=UPI0034E48569
MNWIPLLRRLGRHALRLIPSEPLRTPAPKRARPTPDGQLRLHLFSADFDGPEEAHRFCFIAPGADLPVDLTRELTGAFIDTDEVEMIHGDIPTRLIEFLSEQEADDIVLRMAGDNTLILITEHAFGGLPYELDDTDRLTYLGPQLVAV